MNDLNGLPGVDFKNTVVTEIDCGPGATKEKGILSKAKGWASRITSIRHSNLGIREEEFGKEEDIEMHAAGDSHEIIVSYDVWRTVEEKNSSEHKDGDSD
jgi:hypothetical protein